MRGMGTEACRLQFRHVVLFIGDAAAAVLDQQLQKSGVPTDVVTLWVKALQTCKVGVCSGLAEVVYQSLPSHQAQLDLVADRCEATGPTPSVMCGEPTYLVPGSAAACQMAVAVGRSKLGVANVKDDETSRDLSAHFGKLQTAEKTHSDFRDYVNWTPVGVMAEKEVAQAFATFISEEIASKRASVLKALAAPQFWQADKTEGATKASNLLDTTKGLVVQAKDESMWHETLFPLARDPKVQAIVAETQRSDAAFKVATLSVQGYGGGGGKAA